MSGENLPTVEDQAYAFAKARQAMEESPFGMAARLLAFLQAYPAGRHAREAAESVEVLAAQVRSRAKRALLLARLRELRDPHLPTIHASTWEMSESHRRLLALEQGDETFSSEDAAADRSAES
ncbi:MAG: hypothetical protein GXP55_05315 [Deltaproteobacteria bacterium]|nr:hypothetical protein [Deltaproteobacteria bacterium]